MLEIKQFIEKCQQIIVNRYGKIFVASLHNEKQGGSSNFFFNLLFYQYAYLLKQANANC